jgi:hypothetical protein
MMLSGRFRRRKSKRGETDNSHSSVQALEPYPGNYVPTSKIQLSYTDYRQKARFRASSVQICQGCIRRVGDIQCEVS